MRVGWLIIALLCLSSVSAYHTTSETGVYAPKTITGKFISQSRSLEYKQRFGECKWVKAKGTVCTWNEEPLPYYQEFRVGGRKVRDLATSISPWGSQRAGAIQSFGGSFNNFKVKDTRKYYERYLLNRMAGDTT